MRAGVAREHVRRGDVVAVHSLRRGAAEAIEAIAHGDTANSKVVGKTVEQIDLPTGTTIGAIIRGDEVIMAHHDIVIKNEDHLILFLLDKNKEKMLELVQHHKSDIKRSLSKVIGKQIRKLPDLVFHLDLGAEHAQKMNDIFKDLDIPPEEQ